MTADDAAIRIVGAHKTYPRTLTIPAREAVRDVSLTVKTGTVHGVLGPNGAGKTTTIKMLLGLVRPSGGQFEILGVPAARAASRRCLGFLPEQPYFPPQLTAKQAMRLYGRLLGMSKREIAEQTADLLREVGLHDRAETQLSRFSRGMLQRLGIAQALLGKPQVVVLDEPASGLDPVGQRDVRSIILGLREAGVTVLLSSHQLSEVEAICDRVSIFNRGTVAAEGHIDELLSIAGRSSFVVACLDRLPANVGPLAHDVHDAHGGLGFSALTSNIQLIVDAVYAEGGSVVSVTPARTSLEDYFTGLLEQSPAAEQEVA